jgi:hypothetical protein
MATRRLWDGASNELGLLPVVATASSTIIDSSFSASSTLTVSFSTVRIVISGLPTIVESSVSFYGSKRANTSFFADNLFAADFSSVKAFTTSLPATAGFEGSFGPVKIARASSGNTLIVAAEFTATKVVYENFEIAGELDFSIQGLRTTNGSLAVSILGYSEFDAARLVYGSLDVNASTQSEFYNVKTVDTSSNTNLNVSAEFRGEFVLGAITSSCMFGAAANFSAKPVKSLKATMAIQATFSLEVSTKKTIHTELNNVMLLYLAITAQKYAESLLSSELTSTVSFYGRKSFPASLFVDCDVNLAVTPQLIKLLYRTVHVSGLIRVTKNGTIRPEFRYTLPLTEAKVLENTRILLVRTNYNESEEYSGEWT